MGQVGDGLQGRVNYGDYQNGHTLFLKCLTEQSQDTLELCETEN